MANRKCLIFVLLGLSVLIVCVLDSCAAMFGTSETTGIWNDEEMDYICNALISDMVDSPGFARYTNDLGHIPVIRIGTIKVEDDAHANVFVSKLNNRIYRSGKADVVLDRSYIRDLHIEQDYGLDNSLDSASIGNESGVDLLLQGRVEVIIQENMWKTYRTYHAYLQLTDTTTGKLIWMGENSQITKEVVDEETTMAMWEATAAGLNALNQSLSTINY